MLLRWVLQGHHGPIVIIIQSQIFATENCAIGNIVK